MEISPYRPHDKGHDYYGRGLYLITVVVSGRQPLLAHFSTELGREEHLVPTQLGEAVREEWEATPAHQAARGNCVKVHACVCKLLHRLLQYPTW